jgi:hypothetical protein
MDTLYVLLYLLYGTFWQEIYMLIVGIVVVSRGFGEPCSRSRCTSWYLHSLLKHETI